MCRPHHVDCRKVYTRHADYQNKHNSFESSANSSSNLRSDSIFNFKTDCFLCGKTVTRYEKECKNSNSRAITVRTLEFQQEIYSKCHERKDSWSEQVLGRLKCCHDLVASDAIYHQRCSIGFRLGTTPKRPSPPASIGSPPSKRGRNIDAAREEAFQNVITYMEEHEGEQIPIVNLIETMGRILGEKGEPYSYKHMKAKLTEHFGNELYVTELTGKLTIVTLRHNVSNIIHALYSKPESCSDEERKLDIIKTAAKLMKSDIASMDYDKNIFPSCADISSPGQCKSYLPMSLQVLLNQLFVGTDTTLKQAAIGQAIVQSTRPRSIVTPLQMGLAVQLHLHFGSRYLIDTLNDLGLCVSYHDVQKFEQSAAATQGTDIPGFIPGHFIQYIADNIDHNSRTLDGSNTFHGMGIVAAITPGSQCKRVIPRVKVTSEELLSAAKIDIQFCKGLQNTNVVYQALPDVITKDKTNSMDLLWKTAWLLRPKTPAWNGTMQMVHKGSHPGKASILFLPIIDMDPNNETCVYTTLCFVAKEAKKYDVCPVVTFDQPLWWKALQIIENEPPTSPVKQTVLKLGGFHLQMSLLGSIGYLMTDSGLKELLGTVYAENVVPHMLSGKAIARAIRGHTLVEIALYCILVSSIFNVPLDITEPDIKTTDDTPETVSECATDADSCADKTTIPSDAGDEDIKEAAKLLDNVISGELPVEDIADNQVVHKIGKRLEEEKDSLRSRRTATLWLLYLDMVDALRMFIKAERTGNWLLHLQAATNILPYFAASGHNAYTKSVSIYLSKMHQLCDTHPVVYEHFMNGHHVIRRTDRFWGGVSSDLIIEQELMRSIKTVGGLTRGRGIDERQRALWILSRPVCVEINNSMQQLTGTRYTTSDQHTDCSQARMVRDERDIRTVLGYLLERNPFDEETELRSIATGVVSDESVNVDRAKSVGEAILMSMTGRTVEEYSFRKKLQAVTMSDTSKIRVENDELVIDPQILFQRLVSAAQGSVPKEDLEHFFAHELCSYPPALFENSQLMREASKSVLATEIQKMVGCEREEPVKSPDTHYVIDGGALLQRLPWPKGMTYLELCNMYVKYITGKYASCTVVFDGYQDRPSTKDNTHQRRTAGKPGKAVKVGEAMLMNSKKQQFLSNKENKQRFITMLGSQLLKAGVRTNHAEAGADYLIVKTAIQSAQSHKTILVGEDTDLLVLMCFHATDLPCPLYLVSDQKKPGKSKRVWNIAETRQNLGPDICRHILFLHAILGCDTTSKPSGIGKGAAIKLFKKQKTLQECANVFDCHPNGISKTEIINAGEKAMMCIYKANPAIVGLNKLRVSLFLDKVASSKVYVDPKSLPPTADACAFHSLRVYFQILEWKGQALGVGPEDYGWVVKDNLLKPVKSTLPPAPENILKLIRCSCKAGCKTMLCSCRKAGLECTLVCKHCNGGCLNSAAPDDTSE